MRDGTGLIVLPVVGDGLVKRIVDVGSRHQGLDREKDLTRRIGDQMAALDTLTALIWRAGDHLFLRMSRQMRPVNAKHR